MTFPGSGGPGWPGDPSGQNPAQPPEHTTPLPTPPPYGQPTPPYGQPPPPYGQPTPAYGQPTPPAYGPQPGAYGQPGSYGQPPPPPGYGTPYGPQPPRPGGSKVPLIAAIVVLLLVAAGVTAFFLLRSDSKPKPKASPSHSVSAGAQSSAGFPSGSSFPSDATSATPGSITETDARQVVVRYLDDVNAQDRTDAETLICSSVVETWKASIDKAGGDFTVSVTHATFQGSTASTDGLDVKYSLDVKELTSSKTGTSPVTFTIVDEGGLKICGET